MELQVDLRRGCAVGAAVDVELPVAERRTNCVQVVHGHARSVLGHVAAVRLRSPGAALVDEQEVAKRVQLTRLPPSGERLLGRGVSRPAREIGDRVPSGRLRRAQEGRPHGARSCARSAPRGSPGRRRCRSGRRSPAPRTAPAATTTAPRPKRTLGRRRRRHQHRCRRRPPGRPETTQPTDAANEPDAARGAHLSTWANLHADHPSARAMRHQGAHGSCVRTQP